MFRTILRKTVIVFLNVINQLICATETQRVSCEVEADYLSVPPVRPHAAIGESTKRIFIKFDIEEF
jgi:hypothetical protein